MHDDATRIAVLRLARRDPRPSNRAIATAVGISRESVDNILGSGEATAPPLERRSKLDPHLDRIRELFVLCRTNLVRVQEKLADDGIVVAYPDVDCVLSPAWNWPEAQGSGRSVSLRAR